MTRLIGKVHGILRERLVFALRIRIGDFVMPTDLLENFEHRVVFDTVDLQDVLCGRWRLDEREEKVFG